MNEKQLEKNLPEGWKVISGEKITMTISKGESPKWQGYDYIDEGILFITSENVRDGYIDLKQKKYIPVEFHNKLSRSKLIKGDLLINLVGASIGRSCIFNLNNTEANINQAVCLFRLKKDYYNKYISYYFQLPQIIKKILNQQVSTARANISLTDLRKFNVILPPLSEQRKIAEILSLWDDAIDKMESLIETKTKLKKGLMQKLLTGKVRFKEFKSDKWEMEKLKKIFDIKIGGTPARDDLTLWDINKETNNKWISISDLNTKYIMDTKEYISNKGIEKSNAKLIPKNTVIMSFKLTIGKRGILNDAMYTNEAICSFLPKNKDQIIMEFLYQIIPMIKFDKEIDQAVKGKTLNKEKINRLEIPLPTLQEQEKIASVLSAIDNEIDLLNSELSAIKKQKNGLMQKLLTGKIRVKVNE